MVLEVVVLEVVVLEVVAGAVAEMLVGMIAACGDDLLPPPRIWRTLSLGRAPTGQSASWPAWRAQQHPGQMRLRLILPRPSHWSPAMISLLTTACPLGVHQRLRVHYQLSTCRQILRSTIRGVGP